MSSETETLHQGIPHIRRPRLREPTRPRQEMPPPIRESPEVLATALFNLPEDHVWIFMKGKSFRD